MVIEEPEGELKGCERLLAALVAAPVPLGYRYSGNTVEKYSEERYFLHNGSMESESSSTPTSNQK
jgi:hypothetical protein